MDMDKTLYEGNVEFWSISMKIFRDEKYLYNELLML